MHPVARIAMGVLAVGCAAPRASSLSRRAQPAGEELTPSRRFALDALGPELLGADSIQVRVANGSERIVACVAPRPEITCMGFDRLAPHATALPYALPLMSRDAAREIDTGEASQSLKDQLRHDMAIFRDKLGAGSRPLTRACAADRAVTCRALGAAVTITPGANLEVPAAGEPVDLSALVSHEPDCAVHLVHGEVWSDERTRRLVVLADVQLDCNSEHELIGHCIDLP